MTIREIEIKKQIATCNAEMIEALEMQIAYMKEDVKEMHEEVKEMHEEVKKMHEEVNEKRIAKAYRAIIKAEKNYYDMPIEELTEIITNAKTRITNKEEEVLRHKIYKHVKRSIEDCSKKRLPYINIETDISDEYSPYAMLLKWVWESNNQYHADLHRWEGYAII